MNMKSMMKDCRKYLAEMLGTMILVILGCGTAVFAGAMGAGAGWIVAVAFAFGLALVAIAYTIGTVSGAHINPAVSLGMVLKKRISWKDFAFYVVFQVIGAIIGAAILFALFKLVGIPTRGVGGLGSNSYSGTAVLAGLAAWEQIVAAIIVEVVLTFIFVLTILGVTRKTDNKVAAGLIIGLTLVVVHLFAITITGTSVNPARSIGPAIFAGVDALKEVWVFIVAPLVGGALAAVVACCLYKGEEKEDPEKAGAKIEAAGTKKTAK